MEWLQIFYIPAPGCTILPSNTVCVSYIKTRSLGQFQQTITRLMGEETNPAMGIFTVSFKPHSNDMGNYFSVRFDWRKRKGQRELNQLTQIASFLETIPRLVDFNSTRDMVCIDSLSEEDIENLMQNRTQLPEAM